MRTSDAFRAWGRILQGYHPILSIEITKACPLSCPGCYAYQPEHVSGAPLLSLDEFRGDALVRGVLDLVERCRPLVVYLVGGEPLVRQKELDALLPELCREGREIRLVTSAVRPIPSAWRDLPNFGINVSVDGLPEEHDARRKPATYDRILKHIEGHDILIHCTVTSAMMRRDGYLEEFMRFWSERPEVTGIHVSLFTPQMEETSDEILTPEMRRRAASELDVLRVRYPKLQVRAQMISAYIEPPRNPRECIFARTSRSVSADLKSVVEPCQFGGRPNCSECGCMASIALHAVGQHRTLGGISLFSLFQVSDAIGRLVRRLQAQKPEIEERCVDATS